MAVLLVRVDGYPALEAFSRAVTRLFRRGERRLGWAVTVAVMCLCTACGASGDTVSTTAARFVYAIKQGDGEAACQLLAPATEKTLTSDGTACAIALIDLDLPVGGVRATSIQSDRAQVRIGDDDVLFLVATPDGWRVAAAGCDLQAGWTYQCQLEPS